MTKEELEKLQKDPLWKAHKIVGRDANGKLVMEEITAQECAETTHENFVYKQPSKTKKYKLENGKLVSAGEGTAIRDANGVLYRNMEDYKKGITARMRCEGYTEPQPAPAPEPKPLPNPLKNFDFGKDMPKELLQRAGWNDGVVGKEPETKTAPEQKTDGWKAKEIVTDNRNLTKEELRDKGVRPSALSEKAPATHESNTVATPVITGKPLTVDYIEHTENGAQRIWLKTRGATQPINYVGNIELKNVKHITLTDEAVNRWLNATETTVFFNEDILHINGKNIGSRKRNDDIIYAGCYTIKLDGDEKTIASKHNNMFDCLEKDLRGTKNTNINLRNAVKKCGVIGAEIHVSKAQQKEDDAKDIKRETVKNLKDGNTPLYNNNPVAGVEEATVGAFDCVSGFEWRTSETDAWNRKDTENLIYDMWLTYTENGGKENGMYYKIY